MVQLNIEKSLSFIGKESVAAYEQEVKAVECLQYANFPHFSCMDKNIFISLPQESYIKNDSQ